MSDRHSCVGELPYDRGAPNAWASAILECNENDAGEFRAGNDEYLAQVNFCPYCGAKAPTQIDMTALRGGYHTGHIVNVCGITSRDVDIYFSCGLETEHNGRHIPRDRERCPVLDQGDVRCYRHLDHMGPDLFEPMGLAEAALATIPDKELI